MPDVFVSYKRRIRTRVLELVVKLRELEFDVWLDASLVPGTEFSSEIAENVRAAKAVLVCWTPDAFSYGGDTEGWVRGEAQIGRKRRVLASAMLEQCELDPPFNNDHCEDLAAWDGDDLHEGYLRLVERLGELCGRKGLADLVRAQAAGSEPALVGWAQAHPRDRCSAKILDRAGADVSKLSRFELEDRIRVLEQAVLDHTGIDTRRALRDVWVSRITHSEAQVSIQLINGVRIAGRVVGYDGRTLLIEREEQRQLVFIDAIATFVAHAPVRL